MHHHRLNRAKTTTPNQVCLLITILYCLAAVGIVSAFEQPPIYQLKPKDQVLILGDSTTAGGVLVAGYVRLVDQAQHEQRPGQGIVVRGMGWSGSTMKDLSVSVAGTVKPLLTKPNPPNVR